MPISFFIGLLQCAKKFFSFFDNRIRSDLNDKPPSLSPVHKIVKIANQQSDTAHIQAQGLRILAGLE
jgi:hypothetical protein